MPSSEPRIIMAAMTMRSLGGVSSDRSLNQGREQELCGEPSEEEGHQNEYFTIKISFRCNHRIRFVE